MNRYTHPCFTLVSASLVWTSAACLQGCANQGPTQDSAPAVESSRAPLSDRVGAELPTYSLDFPMASSSDLVERSRLLASTLSKRELDAAPFKVLRDETIDDRDTDMSMGVALGERSLALSYLGAMDRMGVIDERVKIDNRDTETDIGQAAARSVFGATVREFADSGLVEADGLDLDDLEISRTMQAEGRSGEAPKTKVTDYVFFAPLSLHGIKVRYGEYEAGLKVAVHRTGSISSIKLSNPAIRQVGKVVRAVASSELDERVHADYPKAEITPLGLSLSLDVQSQVHEAAPLQTYRVVPTYEIDGKTIHGRVTYAFYRVDVRDAARLIWPTPNADAQGDARSPGADIIEDAKTGAVQAE